MEIGSGSGQGEEMEIGSGSGGSGRGEGMKRQREERDVKGERVKKEAIKNSVRVSDLLVDAVNGSVQEAFIYEKRIELETRDLDTSVARFGKQTDQWLAASHGINTALKEIGDFENWMKTMEYDCKRISAAICNIYKE
ncbi:biogenesis of lysosome-related organelles complex 1 subunit 1-like [Impatiens glandulifera]|uniref:biogenesis of lysosome-related organelles complex 1 subunit 1-like n=1 Tax=Impatiens glandulifera TaxID=253017 RepID=UPI001FB16277|nr:biogenesis of lysosome-related organelles complex 1 subunit 1-like [Impatiens glandulifera]